MNHNIKPGVATGDQVQEIFKLAKQKKKSLPGLLGFFLKLKIGQINNSFLL